MIFVVTVSWQYAKMKQSVCFTEETFVMQGIKKYTKFIILGVILLLIGVFLLIFFLNSSKKIEGVDIRLQRLVGSVNLYDENGKDLSLIEKMRLNSGNTVTTAKESLVMMSLDEIKLITLEALSKAKITSSGKKLEVDLQEGNIFFNVTEKLDADASFDISTGNMVCGIRGTSAYGGVDATGHAFFCATTGTLYLRGKHPRTGAEVTIQVTPGNKATLYLDDEAEGDKDIAFATDVFREEDLTPMALDAIRKDPELQKQIAEETGFSIEKIIALADATSVAGESMVGEAAEQLQSQGINDSVPIMGQEAWDMVDTANNAVDVAEDSLELEIAIITGVKEVLLAEKEEGVEGDDLSTLIKASTSLLCETVKVAKEKGLKDEDLVALTKTISGSLLANAKKMTDLSSEEVASVIGAMTDVYTESITVAANGASGDPTNAVLGAVTSTSEYIDGVVDSEMALAASGDETVEALLGFVDNEQEDEDVVELVEGDETADNNVVVTPTTATGRTGTLINDPTNSQPAATTPSQAAAPTAATGSSTSGSGSSSSGSDSGSGSSGGGESGGGESGGGDTPAATTYKVNLVTNGGTINSGNITEYTVGEGATLPTDVTREASAEATYTFAGWFTEETEGTQVTIIGTSATGDKTYYAHWNGTPRTYGINITTDGQGTAVAAVDGNVVSQAAVGASVTIGAVPAAEYVFSKWEDTGSVGIVDTTSAETSFTMPAKEASVKAVFVPVEYAVTIGTIDHGSLSADKSTAAKGTTVTLTATPESGYDFAEAVVQTSSGQSISVSGTGNSRTFEMPGEAVTVTANFTLKDLTVSMQYDEQLGGGIEVNDQSYSGVAHMGDTVKATVLVTDSSRYEIDEVVVKDEDGTTVTATEETSGSQKTYTFTMPSKSVTVTAKAKKIQYAISFGSIENGTIEAYVDGNSATTAAEGDTVTLKMTPSEGYYLSWMEVSYNGGPYASVDPRTASKEITMPAGPITVEGTFALDSYTFTWNGALSDELGYISAVNVQGDDTNYAEDGSIEREYGTTVVVTASRSSGKLFNFGLVDGEGQSVGGITTTLVYDDGIYFVQATFTIPGKNVTLTATEDTNNTFDVSFNVNNPDQATVTTVKQTNPFTVDERVQFRISLADPQGYAISGNDGVTAVTADGNDIGGGYNSSDDTYYFDMPPKAVTVNIIVVQQS